MAKKKALLGVVCLAMVALIAVFGTVAFLTDRDAETNVFTSGDVAIDLTEDFAQGAQLLPGVNVEKEVVVTNTGKNDAWVWVTVSAPTALDSVITWENKAAANNSYPSEKAGYTEYLMLYPTVLSPNATTTPFFNTVALDKTIDIDPEGNWYTVSAGTATKLDWTNAKGNPVIYVNAYAIQADTFDTVEEAYDAYVGQWGGLNGEKADAPTVAEVDTAAELKSALTDGGVVVLNADVTVAETMTVPADKEVTLNLNGNDLSYAVSNSGASAIINNKGTMEIVGEGTISFVADNPDLGTIPSYATNTITNTGTLTIGEGVTVTNGSQGGASYAVDNHGVFTLDGGTLIGDRCALRVAKYNQDNVVFVMNDGLVKAATPAWIQLPGSDSNVAPKISVTINGGTFKSTKDTSVDNNVMYTYSYGNSHANTNITINGGEFLGGTVSIGSGYKGDAPALTINGGTFEYDVLQWLAGDTSAVIFAANK